MLEEERGGLRTLRGSGVPATLFWLLVSALPCTASLAQPTQLPAGRQGNKLGESCPESDLPRPSPRRTQHCPPRALAPEDLALPLGGGMRAREGKEGGGTAELWTEVGFRAPSMTGDPFSSTGQADK